MKAIRKSDGKEIDVQLFHPCEYIAVEPDADFPAIGGRAIFRADDLIIDEPIDWAKFRREVAKEILGSFIPAAAEVYELESLAKDVWCKQAVEWADELIKQLKQ